jgi:hypothetical protein
VSETAHVPLLGDLPLEYVQRIDQSLDAGFTSYPIVGLAGEWQQRAGRASHRIYLQGLIFGDDAPARLAALQAAAVAAEPLSFTADITSALELQRVVIAWIHVVELAGQPRRFEYELVLAEHPPLPPPAEVEPFGGLGEFGAGDLGFDTDIGGAISNLADQAGSAVSEALDVMDKLGVLGNLDGVSLGGFLSPLEEASTGITAAGAELRDAVTSLAREFVE